jgi:hypothetical protein
VQQIRQESEQSLQHGTAAQDQGSPEFTNHILAVTQSLADTFQKTKAHYEQFQSARTQVR